MLPPGPPGQRTRTTRTGDCGLVGRWGCDGQHEQEEHESGWCSGHAEGRVGGVRAGSGYYQSTNTPRYTVQTTIDSINHHHRPPTHPTPTTRQKRGFPTVLGAWITENRFRARSSCSGLKTSFAFSQECTGQFIIFHMTKIACADLASGERLPCPCSIILL